MSITTFFSTLKSGHLGKIESMAISGGAELLSAQNEHGITPLVYCLNNNLHGAAKLLVRLGAPVNQACSDGTTPLMAACGARMGDEFFNELKKRNVDIHALRKGCNALHWAIGWSNPNAVAWLIANGVNASQIGDAGETPMSKAIDQDFMDGVEQLHKAGVIFTKEDQKHAAKRSGRAWAFIQSQNIPLKEESNKTSKMGKP